MYFDNIAKKIRQHNEAIQAVEDYKQNCFGAYTKLKFGEVNEDSEEVFIYKIVEVPARMIKQCFPNTQQILYLKDGRVLMADPASYRFRTGKQFIQVNKSKVDGLLRANPADGRKMNHLGRTA